MIEVHEVSKTFGKVTAVDAVDVRIPRGATYGLVGPNGAGKTTLLRMLCSLEEADAGRIEIDGMRVTPDAKAVQRRIGFMSDFFGLNNDLTAEEYLTMFGLAYRMAPTAIDARIEELLTLCNLSGKRGETIEGLSRGMRQRLYLAKTLLHDPELLLLDEPASGLDPLARLEFQRILHELKAQGKTIVVSSHILSELSRYCDYLGVMEKGRLVHSAPIAEFEDDGSAPTAYRMTVRGEPQVALEALGREEGVGEVRIEADGIGFVLPPQTDVPALLRRLLEAGIEVISFAPAQSRLESLFMGLDHHEVS